MKLFKLKSNRYKLIVSKKELRHLKNALLWWGGYADPNDLTDLELDTMRASLSSTNNFRRESGSSSRR